MTPTVPFSTLLQRIPIQWFKCSTIQKNETDPATPPPQKKKEEKTSEEGKE